MTTAYVMDFIKKLTEDKKFRDDSCLGSGSAREAYKISDDLVLKIPIGALLSAKDRYNKGIDNRYLYGKHQTLVEIDVWQRSDDYVKQILNPIILHGQCDDFFFEVQPIVKIAEDEDYYGDIVSFASDFDADFVKEDIYNDIVAFLTYNFSLGEGDLFDNAGNYGITKDNRVVLIDYGFQGWTLIQEYVRSVTNSEEEIEYADDSSLCCYSSSYFSW